MSKYTLIKNAKAIITCNEQDDVYYNADVFIKDQEIVQIGSDISYTFDDSEVLVVDASGKFVYPGLINTHHHFFQSYVRNISGFETNPENTSLVNWLTRVYNISQLLDSNDIYYASMIAMADLIKHGCTTAFDLHYLFTKNSKDSIDKQMDAAKQIGMRFHAGRGTNTIPIKDGSMIPDAMHESTEEYLEDAKRVILKYHDASRFSMRQIVLAPCQPINCYAETFTETVKLARKHGVFMHTHMYEGESGIMEMKYGKRTFDWCKDLDFVGKDVWIAHGWEIQPDEYAEFASHQVGISYCPVAGTISGSNNILDMAALIDSGVNISIGCDGAAGNDGSNMLDSLRTAYLLQQHKMEHTGRCIAPYELLKMATVNGSKTLGRNDIGSLEKGKAADLFMINTNRLELGGALHDPLSIIMSLGLTGPVWMTMINGEIVYKDDTLLRVDEQKLVNEAEKCAVKLRNQSPVFDRYVKNDTLSRR